MSLLHIRGGRVVDPANGRDEVADLWIRDDRIVDDPGPAAGPAEVVDAAGMVVMAGGIDIHSHLGGGKITLARAMMADDHREGREGADTLRRGGSGVVTPSSFATGYRYAEMGYTAAFEPAMLPSNARGTHAELADTPIIDKGCYAVLGNDDFLLRLLAEGDPGSAAEDYVAWTLEATQALAVKIVNPGGISAFKLGGRELGLDEPSPHYGLTPRRILTELARAVQAVGIAHPLHVHCNDLGVPGNLATTLATIEAADGVPLHLTHVQFHAYGEEGERGMSSGAAALAEAVRSHPSVSIDVGQVMFGQTVTVSADTMAQYRGRVHAHPRTWLSMDIECDAGCGVVPIRYRDTSYVNALQWAIGLELFLMVDDPWRIFLTTDHPNGAPFGTYPHLIRLLMDRAYRDDALRSVHPDAAAASALAGLDREYTLSEIAVLTRAGPARSLGLADRGHLGAGAAADVAVYRDRPDREAMFARPHLVLKDGIPVVRDGELVAVTWGATHTARPGWDRRIEGRLRDHHERFGTVALGNLRVGDDEIEEGGRGRLIRHAVR